MIKEYDVVRLKTDALAGTVPLATEGTILVVLSRSPGAFLVEFMSTENISLGIFTLSEGDLELVRSSEE